MSRYLLRVDGRDVQAFATIEEALDRVRRALAIDADFDPEVIDARTGRACMIGASKRWRDEIAAILGT